MKQSMLMKWMSVGAGADGRNHGSDQSLAFTSLPEADSDYGLVRDIDHGCDVEQAMSGSSEGIVVSLDGTGQEGTSPMYPLRQHSGDFMRGAYIFPQASAQPCGHASKASQLKQPFVSSHLVVPQLYLHA
jgi:hypothetical protein